MYSMLRLNLVLVALIIYVPFCLLESEQNDEATMFGNLKYDSLPERVKEVLRESRTSTDETAHWCCKINPTKTVVDSRTVTVTVVVPVKHTHHSSCGFLWLSRCGSSSYTTGYKTAYRASYKSRLVPTTCPDQHLVCCKDYIKVADQCLPQSRLPDIKDDLLHLHSAGIVVG
ncbi:uncharacterized protein LOC110448601 [Mizuhopecten yessoensis]|uniref:Uncharacterized protein n=1 Tax=Mizuhopecten yessoensis TaxID=6573 RepID=A0A210R5H1_MIZYE|nr:uncharacterized protein LOC110448601 [Mizuhopecten yessoensis]OWF56327.1 hypothetical protein KP79_PYT08283 [Mizuhopecten yessoensis]